jgi:hypothetical protein
VPPLSFSLVSYYDSSVVILLSGRRHGIDDEDIQHGVEQALLIEEIGDDPMRFLILGPD